MQDVASSRVVIRFGDFELDPGTGELRKQGVKIKLQDQPFQILRILLERPGDVVTRDELRQRIWSSDTFVDFDHGLYNAIKKLREALSDTADAAVFIETLPRRGYRFIATVNGNGHASTVLVPEGPVSAAEELTVEPVQVAPPVAAIPTVRRRWRLTLWGGLAAVVAIAVFLTTAPGGVGTNLRRWFSSNATVPAIHSLAVLPLQNLSGDPAQQYFADGMTEDLITDLSQISGLRVASHQSVLRYRKSDKSVPEIGRELNVDALVEGSVQRVGDRVRITAQLIYSPQDKNIWAKDYERDYRDVLGLQSTIAAVIVEEIGSRMPKEEKASSRPFSPASPEVLVALFEGRNHIEEAWNACIPKNGGMKRSEEEFAKGMSDLDRAIQLDPNYVPAQLAMASAILGQPPHVQLAPKALGALNKSLALDENNVTAHLLMADYIIRFDHGFADDAGDHYLKAVELSPDFAEGHEAYAEYLDDLGRFEEGMKEHEKAQALDPNNDYISSSPLTPPSIRLERTRRFMRTTAASEYDQWMRGELEYELGQYAEALKDWEVPARSHGYTEEADAFDRAFAKGGPKALIREVVKVLDQIAKDRWFPRDMIIDAHRYAGDRDGTLSWLETAAKERDPVVRHLRSDRRWDSYRSNPLFQALAVQYGLAL